MLAFALSVQILAMPLLCSRFIPNQIRAMLCLCHSYAPLCHAIAYHHTAFAQRCFASCASLCHAPALLSSSMPQQIIALLLAAVFASPCHRNSLLSYSVADRCHYSHCLCSAWHTMPSHIHAGPFLSRALLLNSLAEPCAAMPSR